MENSLIIGRSNNFAFNFDIVVCEKNTTLKEFLSKKDKNLYYHTPDGVNTECNTFIAFNVKEGKEIYLNKNHLNKSLDELNIKNGYIIYPLRRTATCL